MEFLNQKKRCSVCGREVFVHDGGVAKAEVSGQSQFSKYVHRDDKSGELSRRNDGGNLFKGQIVCSNACKFVLEKEDRIVKPDAVLKYDPLRVEKQNAEIVQTLTDRDLIRQGKVDPLSGNFYKESEELSRLEE